MAKQAQWICGAVKIRLKPRRVGTPGWPATVHPHLPGREMADRCVLLEACDVVLAHAGEKIVGMIVFAHMVEAESPIFVRLRSAFRGPMGRRRVTAWPLAARVAGAQAPIPVRLDPDA